MTHILYFGSETSKPLLQTPPFEDPILRNPKLSIVSFEPSILLSQKISLEGSRKKSSEEYNEFMKLIDFPTLRFKKVTCGNKSIFILDTKNELWCLGACDTGQLGISFLLFIFIIFLEIMNFLYVI